MVAGRRARACPRPPRLPIPSSTGRAAASAWASGRLAQLDDVAEEHEPVDAVQCRDERLESGRPAQDVDAVACSQVQIGNNERGHAGGAVFRTWPGGGTGCHANGTDRARHLRAARGRGAEPAHANNPPGDPPPSNDPDKNHVQKNKPWKARFDQTAGKEQVVSVAATIT